MVERDSSQQLGNPTWLIKIGFLGSPRLHVAESTGSSAGVTEDHDRGRAPAPAFTNVGAGCFLADGVKAVGLDEGLGFTEFRTSGGPGPDPIRFPADGDLLGGGSLVVQNHVTEADQLVPNMLPQGIAPQWTGVASVGGLGGGGNHGFKFIEAGHGRGMAFQGFPGVG